MGFEHPTVRLRGERSNRLRHRRGPLVCKNDELTGDFTRNGAMHEDVLNQHQNQSYPDMINNRRFFLFLIYLHLSWFNHILTVCLHLNTNRYLSILNFITATIYAIGRQYVPWSWVPAYIVTGASFFFGNGKEWSSLILRYSIQCILTNDNAKSFF